MQTDLSLTRLSRRAFAIVVLAVVSLGVSACSPKVDASPSSTLTPPVDTRPLNNVTIPSEALGANLIGDPAEHDAMVYLPPQYFTSDDPLPVLYYLPGHEDATMFGVTIPRDLDTAFETLNPMIIVIVNGLNTFGGSFYTDSTSTGQWSTFLVDDVVPYIDAHFRTIPTRDARGIAGHSMGGFGALDNAMRHSDVFGSVFAMAPGLFDENGLANSQMFASEDHIRSVISLLGEITASDPEAGIAHLAADASSAFDIGYGMAFAPTEVFPYFEYPYTLAADGTLVRDDAIWARWEAGFGNVAAETVEFGDAWSSLLGIGIDCGSNDEYRWIPEGCAYLDAQLTAAGIEHQYTTHTGDHGSRNHERILEHMLPFFSDIFAGLGD